MILILGPGAVGTTLAAFLRAAGQPVRLLVRERSLAAYRAEPHIRLDRSRGASLSATAPELVTKADLDGVRAVVLCTKFGDLDDALRLLPDPLPKGVALISALNGVQALARIRHLRPYERVIPLSIMFNAQWRAPLHAELTTQPQIVLGSQDPALAALFDGTGLKLSTAVGESAVWGKLLVNLANAVLALTHCTFKDLFINKDLRWIYASVLEESAGVLDQAGHSYRLPTPLPIKASQWMLRHGGPLPWWQAKFRNGVGEGTYPSMVADLDNGKKTEVDQLNGEITAQAHRLHSAAPLNQRITELIHEREARPAAPLTPARLRQMLGL